MHLTPANEVSAAEIEARAVAAAWKTIAATGKRSASPPTRARAVTLDGKRYVRVFSDDDSVIAVYRVRPRGELKRMVRPPEKLL
jgi:hypothetical protein